ncbi:MAG: hypothetical protein HYX41_06775 [Bdellovibrio sp.]|nr:hypothetical protein [Bdellovibrio sp.]
MKSPIFFILVLFIGFGASGCAFGPIYSHETARTVGAGKGEFTGGFGNGGYLIKADVGLIENLDIGFHWESLSIGGKIKYAFLNNREAGLSLSGTLGAGTSFGGSYYAATATVSYLAGIWEPYLALRGTYVAYSSSSGSLSLNGSSLNLPQFGYSYAYCEPILGTRVWLYQQHLYFSAELGVPITLLGGVFVGSAGLGYRF